MKPPALLLSLLLPVIALPQERSTSTVIRDRTGQIVLRQTFVARPDGSISVTMRDAAGALAGTYTIPAPPPKPKR